MILSAFLARIREMSSDRGVVSAVSNFADTFGSAHGYCEGRVKKKQHGSIGTNVGLLAGTDATKRAFTINAAVAMSARMLVAAKRPTYLLKVLVCDQSKAELRATPDDTSGATLPESLKAFLSPWTTPEFVSTWKAPNRKGRAMRGR